MNIKIGIAGLGHWGKNILRNLNELGMAHIACDKDPEIIKERRNKFPKINYTLSFDEMLKDPQLEAIVISTPAVTHFRLAKEALNAGKHLLVEKPLALTVKEAEELIELSRKNKKILMVGHILQYHPAVIKLKEKIGELGRVEYIYSNRLNIGKLRTEENILWSFAPHDISAILMLLGEEPLRVSAFGGDYLNRGIYDTTLSTFEFKDGVKGHIFVSWLHPYKEQKLVVVGSKAMAVFDDLSEEKLFLYRHKINWKNGRIPVAERADHEVIRVQMREPLRLELEHFIECIREGKRPKTDGPEGVMVLQVLQKLELSLKNGYSAVHI